MTRRRRSVAVLLCVLALGLAAGGPAVATGHWAIDVPDALEVPARTVTVQDETHTVDGTLRTDPDEAHAVEVTAPDEVYRLYVYNRDQEIVESHRGEGSATFTLDFAGYANGSYALAISHDGDIEAIFPVVVRGYAVDHVAPASADVGETVEVTVEVTKLLAPEPPATVRIIVADAAASVSATATAAGDGSYAASVSLDGLDAGRYTVWAVAQGEATAFGRQEVLGISTPGTLELDDGSSGGGGGAGGTGTATTPTTATTTVPPPTGGPGTTTSAPDATSPTTSRDGTSGTAPVTTAADTDLITPVSPAPTPTGASPLAPVAVGVVVVAAAGALLWRRR